MILFYIGSILHITVIVMQFTLALVHKRYSYTIHTSHRLIADDCFIFQIYLNLRLFVIFYNICLLNVREVYQYFSFIDCNALLLMEMPKTVDL